MPLTRAEATHYAETSRHRDVLDFVAALRARTDPRLAVTTFGSSAEGRELPLLVLSAHGVTTPAEARALGLPVVLIICGIHAGEVEGKEGCLMLVRDLLDASRPDIDGHPLDGDEPLARLTLVLVPLFNPDGNDRIDPGNRRLYLPGLSGQIGPRSGVGTRVNASGINLNRDYMAMASVEMRLLQQRVCQAWAPDLTIDTHATNGSVHRFAMTYDVPHTSDSGRSEPIAYMRQTLLPPVTATMRADHGIETGWYGNFVEDERALDARREADPAAPVGEGWMTYPHHPRFGSNHRGLTGRMDLLLECYSYITFEERVRTTYLFVLETLRFVAAHGDDVLQTVASSRVPPPRVAVQYRLDPWDEPFEVLTRAPRTLDGAPTSVSLPHFARFVGTTVVDRPTAYLVPPGLADHLRLHGLQVGPAAGSMEVEVATVLGETHADGRKILESAQVGALRVSWRADRREAPAGWGLVATNQPLGALAVYLCEPESDDGAVENGLFDAPGAGSEFPVMRVLEAQ